MNGKLLSERNSADGFQEPSNGSCRNDGLSVVIPCYRENPTVIQATVNAARKALAQVSGMSFEIIIVDDGTETHNYAPLSVQLSLRLLRHRTNRGYGASLATGIRAARYPWIAIIDADGTYPAEEFPALVEFAGDYQMVIGARDWKDISPIRRPAKIALTLLASYLANERIPDLNSGMRVFHRRIYENDWRIFPDRFSFSSTLTMASLTFLHDVKFVPIPYRKRVGKSFISPVRDSLRFLYQLLRLSLYFRPLRFFLPLSSGIALLAILRGLRDYGIQGSLGGLTLILFFMAFQIFFFGLIAEIINKK